MYAISFELRLSIFFIKQRKKVPHSFLHRFLWYSAQQSFSSGATEMVFIYIYW